MAQEFHASLSVTLPEEPAGMATTAAAILTSWAELVEKLGEGNPGMKSQFGINETRAKSAAEPAARAPGKRRGRPPLQAVQVPMLPVQDDDPDEAA